MAMVKCPECNGDISDKAITCPHCGYPVKNQTIVKEEYRLTKGSHTYSGFAGFLKVLAVLTWIGGIILAIVGAQVPVSLYRTEFSFSTFLTLLIPYVIYGFILFCMANVVDQVANTYSIVEGINLEKKEIGNDKNQSSISNSKPDYLSKAGKGDWTCSVCRHTNHSWEDTCMHCGERRRK